DRRAPGAGQRRQQTPEWETVNLAACTIHEVHEVTRRNYQYPSYLPSCSFVFFVDTGAGMMCQAGGENSLVFFGAAG
ncbi:MAG: hypothetical protein RMJ55_19475, partial [Roseiflexaceae bacterium]|nr:hypothetical protein [Roseiflexaceae bacterium]